MNSLDAKTRSQVVKCLVDGNSIRATCRITGAAKGTVLKLLADLGAACRKFHDRTVVNVPSNRIQCDEIWSFVGSKDKNTTQADRDSGERGSMWTWTAIDADSKLIVSYAIGARDAGTAHMFMADVADRLQNRVQLTTDGLRLYLDAVDAAFGPGGVDYAMLIKKYGEGAEESGRYSPAVCTGIDKNPIAGCPELQHVSTSFVERQNLTMRLAMRRFTRLTNGFSKKVVNLEHAVSLHFAFYNFCRPHMSLGKSVTPAMFAGLANHIWTIDELLALIPEKPRAIWGSKTRGRKAETK